MNAAATIATIVIDSIVVFNDHAHNYYVSCCDVDGNQVASSTMDRFDAAREDAQEAIRLAWLQTYGFGKNPPPMTLADMVAVSFQHSEYVPY